MSESARSGAWAAQLIRATYGEGDRRRDEQFVEKALLAWLELDSNRRRFLSVLGVEVVGDVITIDAQVTADDADQGRVDIVVSHNERCTRVELKLRADLTPAQTSEGYADFFIVPRGRAAAVRSRVAGIVVPWEDLFMRLAGPEPDVDLERLRMFYEGVAYGTSPVELPSGLDQEQLDEVRAAARSALGDFALEFNGAAIDWDPIDWFTCKDTLSGEQQALDFRNRSWWWSRSDVYSDWEPDLSRRVPESPVPQLAKVMTDLWTTTVQFGVDVVRSGRRSCDHRLSNEHGCVFGRYFERGAYAIEVAMTFGSHSDARIIGLLVWNWSAAEGWGYVDGAWWPRSMSIPEDKWQRELLEAFAYCWDGDPESAFGSLEFAVIPEDE